MRGMLGGPGHTSLLKSYFGCAGAAAGVALAFFLVFFSATDETGVARSMTNKAIAIRIPPTFVELFRAVHIFHISKSLVRAEFQPVLMAVVAERHVVGLVFHQQIRLRRTVRLMAGHAVKLFLNLGSVRGIHDVLHWMTQHRMAGAVLNRQNDDLVFLVVVFGQYDLATEDRNRMLGFQR